MDIELLLKRMENCPCGREHKCYTKVIEISSGATAKVGKILSDAEFGKNILLVADENTIKASSGIEESLRASGFVIKKLIYENMKYAKCEQVDELIALTGDVDSIISVGTGSLNDICRVTAHKTQKKFCIFATAPSMDGFASDTAPIIKNNFKESWKAEQPLVIIADTKVLAASPVELKASGFGDMVAKYIGLVEWKISNILTGEYYCQNISDFAMDGVKKIVSLSNKIKDNNEEAAGAVMEALCVTGIAMKLAGCSRPASGAEHVVSHYLECYKVLRGIWPEYHGKKVGVITYILNNAYRKLAETVTEINPTKDNTNWDIVYSKYDAVLHDDIKRLNTPTVTDEVDPALLKEKWPEIRQIILSGLPTKEELKKKMLEAGAAITPEEVNVSRQLLEDALRYHPYMRYRLLITRLMPMLGLDIVDFID